MSISSTRTLSEKAGHSVWKYLIPPSGTGTVTLSPGSMMAGAGGEGGWRSVNNGSDKKVILYSIQS